MFNRINTQHRKILKILKKLSGTLFLLFAGSLFILCLIIISDVAIINNETISQILFILYIIISVCCGWIPLTVLFIFYFDTFSINEREIEGKISINNEIRNFSKSRILGYNIIVENTNVKQELQVYFDREISKEYIDCMLNKCIKIKYMKLSKVVFNIIEL